MTAERAQHQRKLERTEHVEMLDSRTREALYTLAEETARGRVLTVGVVWWETVAQEYHRAAKVARLAFRRGEILERERQWKKAI